MFQLGGEAPNEKLCWVPEITCGTILYQHVMNYWAGYPGCQGCGGTAALQTWNEVGRENDARERLVKFTGTYVPE